ncbi:hypothetical protein D3C71_1782370 [compost metagenome]
MGKLHGFNLTGALFQRGRGVQVFVNLTGCAGQQRRVILSGGDDAKLTNRQRWVVAVVFFAKLHHGQIEGGRASQQVGGVRRGFGRRIRWIGPGTADGGAQAGYNDDFFQHGIRHR